MKGAKEESAEPGEGKGGKRGKKRGTPVVFWGFAVRRGEDRE